MALAKALERLPAYMMSYLAGMLTGVISDVVITSLAIGSVLLGVAVSSVWWGVATFFLGMVLVGVVHTIAGAIGYSSQPSYDPVMPPVQQPPTT